MTALAADIAKNVYILGWVAKTWAADVAEWTFDS